MSLASNYLSIASLYPLRGPIQVEDSNRRQERRQGDAPSCPPMKGGSHISTMARVTRVNEICETMTASWLPSPNYSTTGGSNTSVIGPSRHPTHGSGRQLSGEDRSR